MPFVVILLLKMAPRNSANVQSSVPEYKNTSNVVCLLEKILVLDKLFSNMSYNAVGQSCTTLCDPQGL